MKKTNKNNNHKFLPFICNNSRKDKMFSKMVDKFTFAFVFHCEENRKLF